MQTRKFLNRVIRFVIYGVLVVSAALPIGAMEGLHYGVRTDVLQPIHRAGSWLWYSNLHTQIPSLERSPHFWLVSASTGVRGVLTPYFIFGAYSGFGQLNNRFGRTYTINSGVECWFPWAKLGMHAYFMAPKIQSKEQVRPLEESSLVKRAIDIKLSATLLPFVRPFLGVYYLAKFSNATSSHQVGSLYSSWGIEWLMTPRCSLEAQNNIGESNLLIRVKLHSAKVRQPPRNERVGYYLQEPVDYYALPIMLLSPDGPDQGVFWRSTPTQPTVSSFQPKQVQPVRHPIQQNRVEATSVPPSYNTPTALRPRASSVDDQLMVHHPQPEKPASLNRMSEQSQSNILEHSTPSFRFVDPTTLKRKPFPNDTSTYMPYGVLPTATERGPIRQQVGTSFTNTSLPKRPEVLQRSNTAATSSVHPVYNATPLISSLNVKTRPRASSVDQLTGSDQLMVHHAEPDRSGPVLETPLYRAPSQPSLAFSQLAVQSRRDNPPSLSYSSMQEPMKTPASRLPGPVRLTETQQQGPVFEAPTSLSASKLPTYPTYRAASGYTPYRRPTNSVRFAEATAQQPYPAPAPSIKKSSLRPSAVPLPTINPALPRNSLVSPRNSVSSSSLHKPLTSPNEDALPHNPEFRHS